MHSHKYTIVIYLKRNASPESLWNGTAYAASSHVAKHTLSTTSWLFFSRVLCKVYIPYLWRVVQSGTLIQHGADGSTIVITPNASERFNTDVSYFLMVYF